MENQSSLPPKCAFPAAGISDDIGDEERRLLLLPTLELRCHAVTQALVYRATQFLHSVMIVGY